MSADLWHKVWQEHARKMRGADKMTRVMRSRNGVPVTEKQWLRERGYMLRQINTCCTETVLDLCCGNGLLSEVLALRCRQLVAVDFVPGLLREIRKKRLKNVRILCCDVRDAKFAANSFDKVVICAGVQYLSEVEVAELLRRILHWLKQGGRLFLFDVPDRAKLWHYVDKRAQLDRYFGRLMAGRQLVGTWFEKQWYEKLGQYLGYSQVCIRRQPPYLMNSFYRFDAVYVK